MELTATHPPSRKPCVFPGIVDQGNDQYQTLPEPNQQIVSGKYSGAMVDNTVQGLLGLVVGDIQSHQDICRSENSHRPFILGVTGLQGCGKSTVASRLVTALSQEYGIKAVNISLDDLYKTHQERQELREKYPNNKLLKVRGQPGTHDLQLARSFFNQFSACPDLNFPKMIFVPSFDKSLFHGDGDRLPEYMWRRINNQPPVQVLIFEGWCLGFRPLSGHDLKQRWAVAKENRAESLESGRSGNPSSIESKFLTTTLANHTLEDLEFVNECLHEYVRDFMGPQHFDCLIHLDTPDLVNVYTWRLEQERTMRAIRGTSMADDEVVKFGKSRIFADSGSYQCVDLY